MLFYLQTMNQWSTFSQSFIFQFTMKHLPFNIQSNIYLSIYSQTFTFQFTVKNLSITLQSNIYLSFYSYTFIYHFTVKHLFIKLWVHGVGKIVLTYLLCFLFQFLFLRKYNLNPVCKLLWSVICFHEWLSNNKISD